MEVILKTDIFEDMKELVGCDNISDLPYRKRAFWEEIKRQSQLTYPKEQLEKLISKGKAPWIRWED